MIKINEFSSFDKRQLIYEQQNKHVLGKIDWVCEYLQQ